MDKTKSLLGEGNPELSTTRYPYISNSKHSLPRNHRQCKSNRQVAASQESLLSSSRKSLLRESRESLLKRYPTSSFYSQGSVTSNKSRVSSLNNYKSSRSQTQAKLQKSFSQNSFPSEFYDLKNPLKIESATYKKEVRIN